jgi:DNA-binding MarR family transcriptional regulator
MDLVLRLADLIEKFNGLKGGCYTSACSCVDISELSYKQMEYLKYFDNHEGVTTSKLAENLGLSKPTVTDLVKKLVKMGMIYKESCIKDGRVHYLKLTEKGRMVVDLPKATNEYLAKRLIETLDEKDVNTLIEILEKLD